MKTWRQMAMAACLYRGVSSAVSFRAAAFLRRLPDSKMGAIEVSQPSERNHHPRRGITIHLVDDLPAEDVTTIDGIPVTKPARTLLDLATVEPEHRIERALDDCLRRKLVSLPFLDRWLEDPRRKRHRGYKILRRLVDARATTGATDSPLETDLLRLIRSEGLPLPMLQYTIRDGDRQIARVDIAYPEAKLILEADSYTHHHDRKTFDGGRARDNELFVLGWTVRRITSTHIEQDPATVVAWIRAALGLR